MNGSIGEVKVHKGIISAHCSIHPFDLNDLSLNLNITAVPSFWSGHPHPVLSATVLAHCGGVDVKIHGGGLCGLMAHFVESDIKKAMTKNFESTVAPAIEKVIHTAGDILAANLSSLPLQIPIETPLGKILFDVAPPGCAAAILPNPYPALSLILKGSFFTPAVQVEPSFMPMTFPSQQTPSFSQDVQLCVGDYVFNSFGWMLYQNDILTATLTNSQIPPDSIVQLNTSNAIIEEIAPSIYSQYPNELMQITISCSANIPSTSSPSVTFLNGGFEVVANVSLAFDVLTPSAVSAFTLQLAVQMNFNMQLNETSNGLQLLLNVSEIDLAWALVNSNVGTINVGTLNTLDSFIINPIMKQINSYFAENTIIVPTTYNNVQLQNVSPVVYVIPPSGTGTFACISSDFIINKRK